MPILLTDAYGTIFAQQMQTPQPIVVKEKIERKVPSSLGVGVASDTNTSVHAKHNNYEIHITIDRHDCHLLCLFIGVFTLSVLFNSNKRNGTLSS